MSPPRVSRVRPWHARPWRALAWCALAFFFVVAAGISGLPVAGPLGAAAQPVTASQPATEADWAQTLEAARGQTVYFHAWAGSTHINAYIAWTAREVEIRYGVRLEHVKLSDTSEAVSRILAEKTAGRTAKGAVDLVWINGENFRALKENDLLHGPWATSLPNWELLNASEHPDLTTDFTIATDGQEVPWSRAQVVFYYDSARISDPPRTMQALESWLVEHPGRFTYPLPPEFLGTTFLKQALYGLTPFTGDLAAPATDANYDRVTAPLWAFLERITPLLWRRGRAYPQSGPRQLQLVADGEIDIAISFNPGEASAAISRYELPPTVRTYVMGYGSLANASFLAIPFNASATEGAKVVANFLLSPEAQAHKLDPDVWGAETVLDLDRLSAEDRQLFETMERGVATLAPDALGARLTEPHPSWTERLEAEWEVRFGVGR